MRSSIPAALLGIAAVVAAQYAWVKPSNFGGFDEWFMLSRVARGVVDHPFANRPLALFWSLPAALLPPSLWSYHALHMLYLAGVGTLLLLVCRRLPGFDPAVAFLAGAFATTWAPLDYLRLNVMLASAGQTFGAYLAVALFVEAWHRRQRRLLLLAALAAFASVRGYEAGAGLLVAAPLLVAHAARPPRPLGWLLTWYAGVGLGLTFAALPLLLPGQGMLYQKELVGGFDPHPLRVLARLFEQYRQHLLPLFTTPPAEFFRPAVLLAVGAFASAFMLVAGRGAAPLDARAARGGLLRLMALGLALAGAGYGVFSLTAEMARTGRTQFFSAPGIGLFLAALFAWLASHLPRAWSRPLLGALGSCVIAVGAARTVGLQQFWDRISVHGDQVRLLSRLVAIAPRLKPNTFVVLIDENAAFAATYTFRQALEYLYPRPGEAVGFVWGKWDFGYPTRLVPDGIVSEPWPQLRHYDRVTFHRFDEILVLHQPKTGPARLLEDWPSLLPPLPPGARYQPAARIERGEIPRERRLLGSPPPEPLP